jgi:hypothetical protein
MKGNCIPVEQLGRVAALPAGDPEREHFDSCARCRSLLVMLAEFESPTLARSGARFSDADAHLREAIAELVHEGEPDPVPNAEARASRSRTRDSWLSRLLPAWPRPAYALAALAVVALAGTLLVRTTVREPRMRDASPGAAPAFAANPVRQVADGAALSWTPVAGADRYRVVFLDATLAEVASLDAGAATTLVLRADALPAALAHGASVAWQVEAFAGADLRAKTPARALVVP